MIVALLYALLTNVNFLASLTVTRTLLRESRPSFLPNKNVPSPLLFFYSIPPCLRPLQYKYAAIFFEVPYYMPPTGVRGRIRASEFITHLIAINLMRRIPV